MKKNMKFASVIAAALFATTPVASLVPAVSVNAATTQPVEVSQTINDFLDHFIREVSVVDASTGQKLTLAPNHDLTGSMSNPKIMYGKTDMLNKYERTHQLFAGKYHGSAKLAYDGFAPASKDRNVNFVTSDGEVVGKGVIKANSLKAQGYVNFEVSIGADSTPGRAKFLGSTKKTTKKHVKKSSKKRAKKHTKKHVKKAKRASRKRR